MLLKVKSPEIPAIQAFSGITDYNFDGVKQR